MVAGKGEGFDLPFTGLFIFSGVAILAVLAPLAPLGLAPGVAGPAVLSLGLHGWRRRALPRPDAGILLTLCLFLAWSGLSLIWTLGGGKAVSAWAGFIYMWLPGLLLPTLVDGLPASAARRIAGWLLPAAALGVTLFAVEVLLGQPIQHLVSPGKDRVDLERDVNRAALLMALLAAPVGLLLWRLGRRGWAMAAVLAPLFLAAVSTSQSALAALLGLLGLLALAHLSMTAAAGLVAAGIVAGMALCGPVVRWMMAAGLAQASWMPDSFRHRVMTWDFVADRLGDHPWIGWGLEASRAIPGGDGVFAGTGRPDAGIPDWPVLPVHPHNLFLQVRLELGWVGAALTTGLLLAILYRLTRLDPDRRPMAVALFGASILTQCFAYGAWQGWLICGMLYAGALVALSGRVTAPS